MQKKLSKTLLIFMMPKMTDFPRKVMFSLSLFVSFLIWKTAGSSSLVAVAGCDGRSDKKELQESIEWKLILFPLSFLFTPRHCRTWPRPSFTPTAACWRTSPSLFLFLWTRYQTWSFPHISLFPGAQVRLRLSRNILVTTASVAFRTSESFHFWTKQQLVTIQLYNWRSD